MTDKKGFRLLPSSNPFQHIEPMLYWQLEIKQQQVGEGICRPVGIRGRSTQVINHLLAVDHSVDGIANASLSNCSIQ